MSHDLLEFVERYLAESSDDCVSIRGQTLLVHVPETDAHIKLARTHLPSNNRRASAHGLTYFDHCGLHYESYAEFLIYLDNWQSWPTKSALRFRVGDVCVSVGLCSHLIPLLFGPYYLDDRLNQIDLAGYSSIRLIGVSRDQAKHVVLEALYYLNSHYLAPIKSGVQIHHLLTQDDLRKLPPWGKADVVSRKRVRRREPIANLPAALLFNQASVTYGDARFLGYYRVLEYFSPIGFEEEVARLRSDVSVSVANLIGIVKNRSERDQLRHLLSRITTHAQRRRLTKFAKDYKLVQNEKFEDLVGALYDFRCSIVHAKVSEMERTRVPNPLQSDNILTHWIYLTRELAKRAVQKLGSKEWRLSNKRMNV